MQARPTKGILFFKLSSLLIGFGLALAIWGWGLKIFVLAFGVSPWLDTILWFLRTISLRGAFIF